MPSSRFSIQASRPARHRSAVVFCCDQAYLPFAALAATQIMSRCAVNFDVCFASDQKLTLPESLEAFDFRQIVINTHGRFSALPLDARRTEAVYLRLSLPEALEHDYDRILYLDSDLCFRHGDLNRVLDLNLNGNAVAAIRDVTQWRTPGRVPQDVKAMNWGKTPYFNSGVLLLDTAAFREQDLTARCIAFGEQHSSRVKGHDQTILNCVLRGDWLELSPMWNWQYTWASRYYAELLDAHIIHFIGGIKPWNDAKGELPGHLHKEYASFLDDHFPGIGMTKPQCPMQNPQRLRKVMLKHALSAGRTADYLNRFPDGLVARA